MGQENGLFDELFGGDGGEEENKLAHAGKEASRARARRLRVELSAGPGPCTPRTPAAVAGQGGGRGSDG